LHGCKHQSLAEPDRRARRANGDSGALSLGSHGRARRVRRAAAEADDLRLSATNGARASVQAPCRAAAFSSRCGFTDNREVSQRGVARDRFISRHPSKRPRPTPKCKLKGKINLSPLCSTETKRVAEHMAL